VRLKAQFKLMSVDLKQAPGRLCKRPGVPVSIEIVQSFHQRSPGGERKVFSSRTVRGEADRQAVELGISEAPAVLQDLLEFGSVEISWLGQHGSGLLHLYDLVVEVTRKPAPTYSPRATSVA
jgi:hypothetical protein